MIWWIGVIGYYKNHAAEFEETDVPAEVKRISSMISPILIPMLEAMADLENDTPAIAA